MALEATQLACLLGAAVGTAGARATTAHDGGHGGPWGLLRCRRRLATSR
jgi:hypothetical protein